MLVDAKQHFNVLRQARRFVLATKCDGHDFSDTHPDPSKRVRHGELVCARCGVYATYQSVFFYLQGTRHGASNPQQYSDPTTMKISL